VAVVDAVREAELALEQVPEHPQPERPPDRLPQPGPVAVAVGAVVAVEGVVAVVPMLLANPLPDLQMAR
jgi:hypothetical protein